MLSKYLAAVRRSLEIFPRSAPAVARSSREIDATAALVARRHRCGISANFDRESVLGESSTFSKGAGAGGGSRPGADGATNSSFGVLEAVTATSSVAASESGAGSGGGA
jgi:hypothetical protein